MVDAIIGFLLCEIKHADQREAILPCISYTLATLHALKLTVSCVFDDDFVIFLLFCLLSLLLCLLVGVLASLNAVPSPPLEWCKLAADTDDLREVKETV